MALVLIAFETAVAAQWLNYRAADIPRLPDGRPNLAAPTPRSPDGKPDLSGLWTNDIRAIPDAVLERDQFQSQLKPEDIVLTSEGKALQQKRKQNYFPGAQCVPPNLPRLTEVAPFKILTVKGMVVFLYENDARFRQVFLDGRELPKDPNPTWWGYSVGKWDGDTLVVDTSGFNDDEFIVPGRRPHSNALHIIERYRRRDFGHLEAQFTADDPKVYTKPWTLKANNHLIPDTELLEYFCTENERDLKHMVGVDK